VIVRHLELSGFRAFGRATFDPEPEGTTVITGSNGTGKTSVLEALAFLGSRRSFRGAPADALVRTGATCALVRSRLERDGVPVTVEAEIRAGGRTRIQVNGKPARGRRDLAAAAPYTVFCPDDLSLVSGGPAGRRDLLDDALSLLDPEAARAAEDTERILRQRAALLRQASGRAGPDVLATLDVWDQRLGEVGTRLVTARERLAVELAAVVGPVYGRLAGTADEVRVCQRYVRTWEGDLSGALGAARTDDLRRGVNTVGPHRDDLLLLLDGREARTHGSQGEQRCLALALRLGVHRLVRGRTELVPVLLLDDVFSELDPRRSRALVTELPEGQSILTTAAPLPEGITVARRVDVESLR
jgi:DNA replication and repair protein RecF